MTTRGVLIPGLTWRSLLIGIVAAALNVAWLVEFSGTGSVLSEFRPEIFSPFVNAVFTLLFVVVINMVVRWIRRPAALSVPELIVVYVMASIATAIASRDMALPIFTMMTYPFWAASPENRWADIFFQYLPKWLTVRDPEAIKSLYLGDSTLYTAAHLQAWAVPVLVWSLVVSVAVFMMLCLNTIVRKQWSERERLTYPIVQLPLAMTADAPAFFRNRLMWTAFVIAMTIELFNGLHFMYPGIPGTPFLRKHMIWPGFFPTHPFNAVSWMDYSFIPSIMGLSFLIPLDVLFSSWFFFLLGQLQRVVSEFFGVGLGDREGEYYVTTRSLGAYLGLTITLFWFMKGHLREVFRKAFGRGSAVDDSGEPMSYRWACWGLIAGSLFLMVFGLAAGMTVPMIITYFGLYLIYSLITARVRAEVGLAGSGLVNGQPELLILSALGTQRVAPGNLGMFTMLFGLTRLYRGNPMPHELEAFKMSDLTGMRSRDMSKAIMAATVVGILVAFWILLHTYYRVGANWAATNGYMYIFGNNTSPRLSEWIESPKGPDWPIVGNVAGGLAVVVALAAIRTVFIGWPFHPIGYALGPALNQVWTSVMLIWFVKLVILRYTGRRGYHTAVPFFLGLILGDYTMGMLWTLIGIVFNIPTYSLFGKAWG